MSDRAASGMTSAWETVPLKSLVDTTRGISYGIVQPGPTVPDGVPIIRVSDVRGGRIGTKDPLRVSAAVESKFSRTRLRGGELLLTLVGTVGETAIVPEKLAGWNTARAVGVIPVRDDIGAYWVQLALRAPEVRERIDSRVNTTVQVTLNLGDVSELPIALPPQSERRAIAHILGTLDDKIELNRRMNETLEAMARALFTSWFVNFDPVRAKAEARDPGLPAHLAALFPDSFEGSELGEIPCGWSIGSFGDVIVQLREQEHPLESPETLFHHFSLPAFDESQRPKIEYGSSIKSQKSRVPIGSILLSKLNPEIERVWLVDVLSGERAVCSTEFLVLAARAPYGRSFAYCLARSQLFRQQIESLVTGTSKSHQRAAAESILNLAVILPPPALAAAFETAADELMRRTLLARRESTALTALRDALLPKLISGELRLTDVDGILSRATA